jgi:hypothetical protein
LRSDEGSHSVERPGTRASTLYIQIFTEATLLKPTAAVLLLIGLAAGCGQQPKLITPNSSRRGVVDDWTTHHVKFSNPGTEADAIRNGTHDKWLRITTDPRFQMQQLKRSPAWQNRFRHIKYPPPSRHPGDTGIPGLNRDWAYPIAPAGNGTLSSAFPAKYSFDINATPSCSDYVVFPVDISGSTTQANIVGFNNLYDGTCPSSSPTGQPFTPTLQFAYYVDSGSVWGSPVLSEDGTKVAFVAHNLSNGATTFHVVTLGTTGNNGTAYNAPVTPCTVNGVQSCITNNAVDTSISIASDSYSSPFVDYAGDVAYVGDDAGSLHKIAGVFRGTPTEATGGGWPFTIPPGNPHPFLNSPVYDSVSQHIFVTSFVTSGYLYCIDVSSGTPALCIPTGSVNIGDAGENGPTVDSTAGTVFAEGAISSSVLTQATISLGNVVQAAMGDSGVLYSGDFDNAYYSGNYAYGYLYFCGSATGTQNEPTLYRIGFDSSGTMDGANDGNFYPLATTTYASSCTPLTEIYNANQGKDYLFLGVQEVAAPSGCDSEACIMSFQLDDAYPGHLSSFPSVPAATLPTGSNNHVPGLITDNLSGIIIDNVSGASGASQIYFSNINKGSATQASQNGLN